MQPVDDQADLADWGELGTSRGYVYRELVIEPKLPGMMFTEGGDVVARFVVDATASETPFMAGSLSASYTATRRPVTTSFIAIPLPRSMPSLVLVSAEGGALSEAGIGMGSRQVLSLGEDFDRAFTLFCAIGSSAVALEVFTPDLMRLFVMGASQGDIEIVGDWLFVYGRPGYGNSAAILDAIEVVSRLVRGALVAPTFLSLDVAADVSAGEPDNFRAILVCTGIVALGVVASLLTVLSNS